MPQKGSPFITIQIHQNTETIMYRINNFEPYYRIYLYPIFRAVFETTGLKDALSPNEVLALRTYISQQRAITDEEVNNFYDEGFARCDDEEAFKVISIFGPEAKQFTAELLTMVFNAEPRTEMEQRRFYEVFQLCAL